MAAPDLETRSSSRVAVLALSLALVGAAAMVYYHLGLFMPRVLEVHEARNLSGAYALGDDFYPVWLTSREWIRARLDPYGPEVTREIQKGLFGRPLDSQIPTDPLPDYRTFAYPAFTDLLFWPAAEFPFASVRVVLVFFLAGLTAASVFLWAGALSWRIGRIWSVIILLLVLCSYPVLEGLYAGQLGLLVGFLLAASLLTLQRGRFLLAGILTALTMIKPQMTVLALLYLLLWSIRGRQERRFYFGFFFTMLALAGAAIAVWPHWIQSWTRVILGYHRYARPPLVTEVFASSSQPGIARAISWAIIVLLLISAVVVAWRNRAAAAASPRFWLTLSFLLSVTAVTLLPGQAVHDHVILLPGIFVLACRWEQLSASRIGKALLVMGVGVILWPWLASCSLIVLRPLISAQQFHSKAVFALPLRTAAAFPFVVLGALAIALRRAQAVVREVSP